MNITTAFAQAQHECNDRQNNHHALRKKVLKSNILYKIQPVTGSSYQFHIQNCSWRAFQKKEI